MNIIILQANNSMDYKVIFIHALKNEQKINKNRKKAVKAGVSVQVSWNTICISLHTYRR